MPRVDDRRVLNGIFWVLRSGAPWADLPERYGPRTTVYNRFNRWRKAGVWDRLMDAIVAVHDGEVQMIDTPIVRVHQQGATAKRGKINVSFRGGLTTKIHALVDKKGRPIKLKLTAGQDADITSAPELIADLPEDAMLIADKGYDANALREAVAERGAWANIPPKIARIRSASANISIRRAISSSASSTRSNIFAGSRPATTSSPKTSSPPSSSPPYAYGSVNESTS